MSDPTNISGFDVGDLKLTLAQAKELLEDRVKQLNEENERMRAILVAIGKEINKQDHAYLQSFYNDIWRVNDEMRQRINISYQV